jgi:hypothetical protein
MEAAVHEEKTKKVVAAAALSCMPHQLWLRETEEVGAVMRANLWMMRMYWPGSGLAHPHPAEHEMPGRAWLNSKTLVSNPLIPSLRKQHTNRDNSLDNAQVLDMLPSIRTFCLIIGLDSSTRSIRHVILALITETLHFLED